MWVYQKAAEAAPSPKMLAASIILNIITCVSTVASAVLITGFGVQQYRLDKRITSLEAAQSQPQPVHQSPRKVQPPP